MCGPATAAAARARVRRGIWPVAQTSVAAGLAWYITRDLLGHAQPFFPPIAAAVSLSASNAPRGQRALQLIAGVMLGIGIGVGVAAVAEGPVAIGVAVLLSMCAALAVGGGFIGQGLMFVNQTAASAILIIALQRSGSGSERLLDALIGGGVVLVISVLLPAAPLRLLSEATQSLGAALRAALTQLDEQITCGAPAEPAWLLAATQRIHGELAQLAQARITARRIVRVTLCGGPTVVPSTPSPAGPLNSTCSGTRCLACSGPARPCSPPARTYPPTSGTRSVSWVPRSAGSPSMASTPARTPHSIPYASWRIDHRRAAPATHPWSPRSSPPEPGTFCTSALRGTPRSAPAWGSEPSAQPLPAPATRRGGRRRDPPHRQRAPRSQAWAVTLIICVDRFIQLVGVARRVHA